MKAERIVAGILLFAGLMRPVPGYAVQSLATVQALDFGSFLIRNNNSVGTVTVTTGGSVSYSSNIMMITTAKRGMFQALGMDPNTDLSITISPDPLTVTCGCGLPDFSVDTFTISPATPHTDGAGDAPFNVGAILRTTGDSAIYNEGPYSGTITITINF